ncbi:uncharacterized protein C8Q71DRAFT_691010, partial [Rhodofomes roseus]
IFSTVTLRGTHLLGPITLSRRESFPSRQFDFTIEECVNRPDWSAVEPPQNSGHLSLELGERIGGGRSAVVYSVKVIPDAPHTDDSRNLDLCVKVARPNRCRSLAREAWVYEQLIEGVAQGVITPRSYGFFATELVPEQLPFPLWSGEDYYMDAPSKHWEEDDPTRDDQMHDDCPEAEQCADPPPGARELSPWVDWRPNPDAPLLSILVMARGGLKFSLVEDDKDPSNQEDVKQILDDLSSCHLLHSDLRASNVIRAPRDTHECQRHKRVHRWNIIDLVWTAIDD